MRDPNRIHDVLTAIDAIWAMYPDLRLGQLISNVVKDPKLYYIEDLELVKAMEIYYTNLSEN